MKPVRVSSTLKNSAGEFIHNHNLSILNYIFIIFFIKCISFEQLLYDMQSVTSFTINFIEFFFLFIFRIIRQRFVLLNFCDFCSEVRKCKEVSFNGRRSQILTAFFSKVCNMIFFFDDEIKFIIYNMHLPGFISVIKIF